MNLDGLIRPPLPLGPPLATPEEFQGVTVCVPHPASKATCQSGLRDVLPKDHLQSWRMSIVGQSPDPVAENIEGFARLDARILIDQRVQSSIQQQFARAVGYFVADENDQPLAATLSFSA
jgi:hypothetical protein